MPALFGFAFEIAAFGLSGDAVAQLLRLPVGDVTGLHWVTGGQFEALRSRIDMLALRDAKPRLSLHRPERDALLEAIGGPGAVSDPRLMFVLAQALDERFAEIEPRITGDAPAVFEAPRSFFAEITNHPPPIGQMTSIAACRRWMRGFWFAGDIRTITSFGSLPRLYWRKATARLAQTLQRAVDDGELRLAVVNWRRHDLCDLRMMPSSVGCFAVGGINRALPGDLCIRVFEKLRASKAHIALFPELSVDDGSFEALRETLAKERYRYPALIAVGRTHRRSTGAAYKNEAVLLDASGEIVLSHEKLEPFTAPDGSLEDIIPRDGKTYEFLDTAVGRIVINICRDVRSDVPALLNRVIGASVFLVPAYSKGLDFVLEEARVLGARQGALTIAANPPRSDLDDASVVYVPIRGTCGAHATKQSALLPEQAEAYVQTFSVVAHPGVGSLDAGLPVAV